MVGDLTQRTLFIHCMGSKHPDGVIRMNGFTYQFHLRNGNLSGRKMKVWVREDPESSVSYRERIFVYNSPVPTSESFIGDAEYDWPEIS